MGTELLKSVVSKGLMVLVQHSFIEALLYDQVGENRRIISNTVYKVRSVCADRCTGGLHAVLTQHSVLGDSITDIRVCPAASVSGAHCGHAGAIG